MCHDIHVCYYYVYILKYNLTLNVCLGIGLLIWVAFIVSYLFFSEISTDLL